MSSNFINLCCIFCDYDELNYNDDYENNDVDDDVIFGDEVFKVLDYVICCYFVLWWCMC